MDNAKYKISLVRAMMDWIVPNLTHVLMLRAWEFMSISMMAFPVLKILALNLVE
jgi:hypothetical protein